MQKKYLTLFQRKILHKNLEGDIEGKYRQRIEIILLADDGKSQTEICQLLGCSQATARHWIMIAQSGQAHCWKDSKIGRPKKINEQYLKRLKELVSQSPGDYCYSFKRWTADWLSRHLEKEFDIKVSDRYINKLLKQMGLSTKPKQNKLENNHLSSSNTKNLLIQDIPNHNQIQSEKFWLFKLFQGG